MVPAVILSSQTVALGVIRALGMRGVPIAVVHYDERDFAHRSKYVVASFLAPHPDSNPEGFGAALEHLPQAWQGSVLIPATDETLWYAAQHQQVLSRRFRVACPDFETVRTVIDKQRTYPLAAQAGIGIPRTLVVQTEEELSARRDELTLPCLVKPSQGHLYYARFGVKMHLAQTWEKLVHHFGQARQAGLEVMLQEYVPGGDDTVWNYNALVVEGRPVAEFTAVHIRNAPPMLGSPRVAQSQNCPELVKEGRRLMAALNFTGFACTEFKHDRRDDRFKLMEVNARHNLSTLLAVKCGIDFPWLEYRYRAYGEVTQLQDFTTGVYWIDLTRDLAYSLRHFKSERYRLGDYLRPYLGPKYWAILSARDMRPFFSRLASLSRCGARQGWSRVKWPPSAGPSERSSKL